MDSRVAQNDPLESVLRAFRRPRSSGKRTYGGRRHVNDRQLSQSYNSAGLDTNKILFYLANDEGKSMTPTQGGQSSLLFVSATLSWSQTL